MQQKPVGDRIYQQFIYLVLYGYHVYYLQNCASNNTTRSSADADNGLDAFVGQSRSKNILNPFQVK